MFVCVCVCVCEIVYRVENHEKPVFDRLFFKITIRVKTLD